MPNHGATIDRLSQLQDLLQSENSPLLAELKTHMAPYEGKISKTDYQRLGGQFAQQWVAKNLFGGQSPTRKDFEGPLRDFEYGRRADSFLADPRNAGTSREQFLTTLQQQTPQPLAKQLQSMEALWSLAPPQEQQATKVQPQQMAPPRQKPTSKSRVKPDPTDDEKLMDSQLMLLEQLGGGGGVTPVTGNGPGDRGGLPPQLNFYEADDPALRGR